MDILGFIAHLAVMQGHADHDKKDVLDRAGKLVEQTAKDAIGTYKFGWPPLDPATVARKGADTPLLQTGQMRDSIEHTVVGDHVDVGTNDKKAVYQELGTTKIPPRSFLVAAAMEKEAEIVQMLGDHSYKGLLPPK